MVMMSSQTSSPQTQNKGSNPVVKTYLVAYNVSQMLGWTALMFIMISHFISEKSVDGLYKQIEPILQICQTAAILEIVHSMVGFVRSNWVLTAFQVYSRVFLIWGVIWSCPVTQNGPGVPMWMMAWTITEMVRYTFYFFSLLPGDVPYILTWSRYTFFIILYPIGVTGELISIFTALPYVKETNMYTIELPNVYNISFNYYYWLCFIVVSYIPVFPHLYFHMVGQRRKIIGGAGKPKAGKTE